MSERRRRRRTKGVLKTARHDRRPSLLPLLFAHQLSSTCSSGSVAFASGISFHNFRPITLSTIPLFPKFRPLPPLPLSHLQLYRFHGGVSDHANTSSYVICNIVHNIPLSSFRSFIYDEESNNDGVDIFLYVCTPLTPLNRFQFDRYPTPN